MIVGAGAAGLMAAIHAAGGGDASRAAATSDVARATGGHAASESGGSPLAADNAANNSADNDTDGAGPEVIVLESTRDGGRKILISGGGRCNILPGELDESRFVTDSSPNTMKKMLRSWPLAEQRRFFEEELGIALKLERESGKLFPASDRARDVRDALVAAARARGVSFVFDTNVVALDRAGCETQVGTAADQVEESPGPLWRLRTADGRTIEASAVILATGGLSVPKTGSDGTGLLIARGLGHQIHEPYAALTPLVCDPPRFGNLAGVSLDVTLTAPTDRQPLRSRGGFLFTHRGYSGPSVLDVAHLAVRSSERDIVRALPREAASKAVEQHSAAKQKPKQKILVQWTELDREAWQHELAPRKVTVLAVVRARMPVRLAEALLREAGVPDSRSLAELRSDERKRLLDTLTQYELAWTGHEGYRTAEVTGGGVALSEVDPRTLESRRCPGLYLCGEILDCFGPIGGYNFLWSWATGRAAGQAARSMTTPRIASAADSG